MSTYILTVFSLRTYSCSFNLRADSIMLTDSFSISNPTKPQKVLYAFLIMGKPRKSDSDGNFLDRFIKLINCCDKPIKQNLLLFFKMCDLRLTVNRNKYHLFPCQKVTNRIFPEPISNFCWRFQHAFRA